jgi:hypothetical protein
MDNASAPTTKKLNVGKLIALVVIVILLLVLIIGPPTALYIYKHREICPEGKCVRDIDNICMGPPFKCNLGPKPVDKSLKIDGKYVNVYNPYLSGSDWYIDYSPGSSVVAPSTTTASSVVGATATPATPALTGPARTNASPAANGTAAGAPMTNTPPTSA